jgi:class 3 adenylate cyclase
LVTAVSGVKTHAPLQTRVGIALKLVVVGDLIGFGASQEQAIVGETPNLAARLQGIAEPNRVVIAEARGQSVRASRPRRRTLKILRSGAGLGSGTLIFGREPFRGAACRRSD